MVCVFAATSQRRQDAASVNQFLTALWTVNGVTGSLVSVCLLHNNKPKLLACALTIHAILPLPSLLCRTQGDVQAVAPGEGCCWCTQGLG